MFTSYHICQNMLQYFGGIFWRRIRGWVVKFFGGTLFVLWRRFKGHSAIDIILKKCTWKYLMTSHLWKMSWWGTFTIISHFLEKVMMLIKMCEDVSVRKHPLIVLTSSSFKKYRISLIWRGITSRPEADEMEMEQSWVSLSMLIRVVSFDLAAGTYVVDSNIVNRWGLMNFWDRV